MTNSTHRAVNIFLAAIEEELRLQEEVWQARNAQQNVQQQAMISRGPEQARPQFWQDMNQIETWLNRRGADDIPLGHFQLAGVSDPREHHALLQQYIANAARQPIQPRRRR